MQAQDLFMTALCLYREARGEGNTGMTAVACVLRNRFHKNNSSFYAEVTKPWQFTSITGKGDPQLILWPKVTDPSWVQAQLIAQNIIQGDVDDITNGATLYFDDSISFPASWDKSKVKPAGKIGRLNLFMETK